MKKMHSNKKILIFTTVLSLFSVCVCAVATAAWFQINSQAPEFSSTSPTPNLTIDNSNVTGYKVQPSLGLDGFPDYISSTVSSKKGGSYETTNDNQAGADTSFDVPEDGLGYYLVKKNPGDSYKYIYNDISYAIKFDEFTDAGINYLSIPSLITNNTDSYIIRQYSYNTATYSTINKKIEISKDNGDFNINDTSYELTPTAASDTEYTVWLNKATGKVTFEEPFDPTQLNLKSNSRSINKPTSRAGGATPESNTVYLLQNGNWWFNDINNGNYLYVYTMGGNANEKWFKFEDSGYKYNDATIWKAKASGSFTSFILTRQNTDSGGWDHRMNQSSNLSFSSSKNYCQNTGDANFNQSSFANVIYDGWAIVGSSTNSESTFYNKSFSVNGAIRLNEAEGNNYGKIVVDLRGGDTFKIVYIKNGGLAEYYGFYYDGGTVNRMEVYNGSVSAYFTNNASNDCVVKPNVSLHCTIYFTNNSDDKHINVNTASTVVIKAAKYSFSGSYVEVDATNVLTYDTYLGTSITKATLNGLSSSYVIPTGYSRVGTDIYTTASCSTSVGTSFVADVNPKEVYIKVQENPITITLKAFFVNYEGDSTGTIDDTRTKTLNTQYGADTVVTASSLESYWKASSPGTAYGTTLTYNSASYTFNRIDNSSHNGAFVDDIVQDGTTLYVRYVRVQHAVSLRPSFFLSSTDGGAQLNVNLSNVKYLNNRAQVSNKTQYVLDNSALASETFANCYWQDHTNGIWYVFARQGTSWYTNDGCTSAFSGNVTSSNPNPKILYAKMVAYPLTTFYADADYPGWEACYIHIWGSLINLDDGANHALTANAVTFDSGNKVYRVSIPTTNVDGFIMHNGYTANDADKTEDVAISDLLSSTSKYVFIGNNAPHDADFMEKRSVSSSGTGVWVQKYSGGSWDNVEHGQLLPGDGVGNDYVLEFGLSLTNNDIIRVCDTKNTDSTSDDVVYGYAQYVATNKPKHKYVAGNNTGGTNKAIQIVNLGAAGVTARFNFYITHSGNISIAMVPDLGNGYYIMKYNSTFGTENFIGAIKMDSSDYSASYNGWYCSNTTEKIYIRSYLNTVDKICNSLTASSLTYANEMDENFCITFKHTGHYNIRITNQIVDISQYTADDFFSLNRLDSSLLTGSNSAKQQAIWNQKTAVVMEIPFIANNLFDATVQLRTECDADWIGVRLYVADKKINEENKSYFGDFNNPYDFMRGATSSTYTTSYLTNAHTSNAILDTHGLTISANSSNTYYAYVLIDYRYTVTTANLQGSTPEIGLYLQVVQA